MKDSYLPIVDESTKNVFMDYTSAVNLSPIDYFAVGIQDILTRKSISLMSRIEWQKIFVDNHFAENDPVRKTVLNTRRNFISLDEIDFFDNFGKEIMRQRAMMGIKTGLVLVEKVAQFNLMITLGTEYSKFDILKFIKSNHLKITFLKRDFIKIIEKDARQFLPSYVLEEFTHPCNGAI